MTIRPRFGRAAARAAAALMLGAAAALYVARSVVPACRRGGKDVAAYYAAAEMLLKGGDFYDPAALRRAGLKRGADADRDGFGYPPLMALAFVPLNRLPFPAARCAWALLNQLFLVGVGALLCASIFPPGAERLAAGYLFALVACCSEPVRAHLLAGQSNLLVLFLMCAGYWAFKRGRPTAAGCALGAAAALKVYPIALIAYFGWKRRWRLLAAAIVTIMLGAAAGVAAAGPAQTWRFVSQVLPAIASHPSDVTNPSNQSIYACFARLFTDNLYTEPVINSPARARWASGICCAALVGITVLLCPPASRRFDEEAALVVIASTLIVTLAWDANFVAMFFPAAVACKQLAARPDAGRVRAAGLLALALTLIHARFPWWIDADGAPRGGMLWCPRLAGALVLYCLIASPLRRGRSDGASRKQVRL